MRKAMIRIEVPDGRIKEILNELDAAQQKIFECYTELECLGVLTIREQATDDEPATC